MKIKSKKFVFSLIVVFSVFVLNLAGYASQPEIMELEMSIGNPVGSDPYNQMSLFAEKLEELSEGTIKVNIFGGGVLFSEKDALDGIMTDIVDFCFLNSSSAASVIKDLAVLAAPGSYRYHSPDDVTSLVDFEATVGDIVESIYNDYGIKWLTFRPPAEAAIICTEKQIKSPSDFESLVFRTSGSWLGKLMNEWGLATATMPIGDVTTALERGTVAGTLTGSEQVKNWKFYEVAPNITLMPETDIVGSIVMSMATWDSMNEKQRQWVEESAQYYLEEGLKMKAEFYQKNMMEFEEGGAIVYQLSPKENEVFMQHISVIHDEMADSCTEKGLELMKLIQEWRKANL